MMWWHWDKDDKCWRATLVPPRAAFDVGHRSRVLPFGGAHHWALLTTDPSATVNGRACLPFEVLNDRDEISLAGERFSLSEQSPAEVVAFDAKTNATKKLRCPRCLSGLVDRDQIVRCPRCGAHHHASCWSYDAQCQKCGLPTSASAWIPDPLN